MGYLLLLLLACAMWLLVAFAATVQAAVAARRDGGEARGVSILAYVTVPPATFTGVAFLIDRARPPVGYWVVFGVHVLLGAAALALALRGRAVLARME